MTRFTDLPSARLSFASLTRLAIGCLILAISSAAVAAVPTLATLNRVASSESETPLEGDGGSLEAALPRSQAGQARQAHRGVKSAFPGCRFNKRHLPYAFRSQDADGHRLANGLTAPLRC
jgi:hypothetical protein